MCYIGSIGLIRSLMNVKSVTVGRFLLCLQGMSSNVWRFRRMSSKPQNPKEQYNRFIETARKLGCDEDKERFEESLGKIAAYKPPPPKLKKSKTTKPAK
jgi:hypothetical protein